MTTAIHQHAAEASLSTEQILEKLVERLSTAIQSPPQPQPISIALWDTRDIAAYLHRSQDRVYSDIVCLPTFPKPIRLPVKGRAQALYKAREVIAWAEKHQAS
jgi:predicted DNA-binding transcriptional regulator AlpA